MTKEPEWIPTRQSLLSRLKDWDDGASWNEFFDTYWKLIYETALRAGLQPADAEDVAQETFVCISKAIRTFRYNPGRGSFKGWLCMTTTWRIRDRQRQQQRQKAQAEEINLLCSEPADGLSDEAIATAWDRDWEKNLADAAMDRVRKRVEPKHFQVFHLAMIKQWPTARIAETMGVRASYIYLVKHRIAAQVRRELKKLTKNPCEIAERTA